MNLPHELRDLVSLSITEPTDRWDMCTIYRLDIPNELARKIAKHVAHEIFSKENFKIHDPQFATSWLHSWRVSPSPWSDMTEEQYGWVEFNALVGSAYADIRVVHNSTNLDHMDHAGTDPKPCILVLVQHTSDGEDYTTLIHDPDGPWIFETVVRFLYTVTEKFADLEMEPTT